MKRGFDSEKYINSQAFEIFSRIKKFKRLYLEIGGKLVYDNHATRILPGYKKTTKIDLLKKLKPLEIIYCINAKDLESTRTLTTQKRTYQKQVLKDLRDIKKRGFNIDFIVITRYENEKKAMLFKKQLEKRKFKVYIHNEIKGYAIDLKKTISGLSKQKYIPVKKDLIIITGPAGNSGKMSLALVQIYHETKKKIKTGFAKYESFPVWNLPINHPINIAYEAATADLQDENKIDPYYKKTHHKNAVNYNRDIDNFKILQTILRKITKQKNPFGYKSPTEMGINMIKKGIINDEICRNASIIEIKNRNKRYLKEYKESRETKETLNRMKELLKKIN